SSSKLRRSRSASARVSCSSSRGVLMGPPAGERCLPILAANRQRLHWPLGLEREPWPSTCAWCCVLCTRWTSAHRCTANGQFPRRALCLITGRPEAGAWTPGRRQARLVLTAGVGGKRGGREGEVRARGPRSAAGAGAPPALSGGCDG